MPNQQTLSSAAPTADERILIVGAGLVGALLSIYLARRGMRVDVFERHPDLRTLDLSAQRSSINLSLCERGFRALDHVGVGNAVRQRVVATYGRAIHALDDTVAYQPYGDAGEHTFAILRNDLNEVLVQCAERDFGVRFHWNERCLDIDLEAPAVTFENTTTGARHRQEAGRVFGADGVFSTVRSRLERTPLFNYSQTYLDHAYAELNLPTIDGTHWAHLRQSVHLWPRGGHLLLGLPNQDGSVVCSLHLPLEGEPSFASLDTPERLLAFLETSFPDAAPLMPQAADDYFGHRRNYLVHIRCFPWTHGGKVALIGDAAHAIVPFYAQGVNAGFEDCLVLDECLDAHAGDWNAVLGRYERRRKPEADAVSDLSLQHFRDLRDNISRPAFLLKKRIEKMLGELYPERFVPVYTMVTFKAFPYSEALRRGREQELIIDRILQTPAIAQLSEPELPRLIDRVLQAS